MRIEVMSSRLNIDYAIKEKSTDFYYSVTDMYDIELFTDDFRQEEEKIIEESTLKHENLNSYFFKKIIAPTEPFNQIENQLFMGKTYEIKYKNYSDSSNMFFATGICILTSILTLGICIIITNKIKKRD